MLCASAEVAAFCFSHFEDFDQIILNKSSSVRYIIEIDGMFSSIQSFLFQSQNNDNICLGQILAIDMEKLDNSDSSSNTNDFRSVGADFHLCFANPNQRLGGHKRVQ